MAEKDTDLLRKIQNDDVKTFESLFNKYYTPLCQFAFFYTKIEADAEEIVQNFFITLWEKRHTLTIRIRLDSYFYKSIKNLSLNYLRDNSKFKKSLSFDINLNTDNFEPNYLEFEELYKLITSAIENLPAKCKHIFLLSREDDLTYKQIAKQLNISVKTVENQLGIALRKIRERLYPYLDKIFLALLYIWRFF